MAIIKVNPDELNQVASMFDQSANEARQLVQRIDSRMGQLDGTWDGNAQTRFYSEYAQWKGQMQTFIQILETGSRELKTTAANFVAVDK